MPPTGLRLVLFGMPDAGKSSLLGALAQAAQTQEHVLNGRLTDLGRGLTELQQRVYEGTPRQTLEELLPFPVAYERFTPGDGARRVDAVVYDCDGRAANDLLSRRRSLDTDCGALCGAVLAADTIILVVDAAAGPAQLESDFTEFARFLRHLEESRGKRTDVGGLPVFLVLTKCDLLAQSGDDLAAWVERMEQRKRQVGERFQEFLATAEGGAPLPFGSVDLHLWATAVKRPALQDAPARPRDPFGVAELFRQAFDSALAFGARRGRSGRRVFLTTAGTFGAVAVLAGLAALLFSIRPTEQTNALDLEVDRFQGRQQELSPLARHQDVKDKIAELSRFASDPAFAELSPGKRAYVENTLKELTAYQAFMAQLNSIPDPRDVRNEAQLQSAKERLTRLAVPAEYRAEWEQAEAGRRRRAELDDISAIEAAVKDLTATYQKLIAEGTRVLERKNEPNLPRRAKTVLEQAQEAPQARGDRDKLIPGSRRVTYATVFDFPDVAGVVQRWDEDVKKKLEPFARLEQP